MLFKRTDAIYTDKRDFKEAFKIHSFWGRKKAKGREKYPLRIRWCRGREE